MKHPPIQYPDHVAREMVERFIKGEVYDPAPDLPLNPEMVTAVQEKGE